MLKPESVLHFGKYKGKTVTEVFTDDPGYLCWMRKTGFSSFGKEITEAIFAWEEAYPAEVVKIEKSIARAKERERLQTKTEEVKPAPVAAPVIRKDDLAWGSW